MRKAFLCLATGILLTLTILFSCQKNQPNFSSEQEQTVFSVTDAKDWYMKYKGNLAARGNAGDLQKLKTLILNGTRLSAARMKPGML